MPKNGPYEYLCPSQFSHLSVRHWFIKIHLHQLLQSISKHAFCTFHILSSLTDVLGKTYVQFCTFRTVFHPDEDILCCVVFQAYLKSANIDNNSMWNDIYKFTNYGEQHGGKMSNWNRVNSRIPLTLVTVEKGRIAGYRRGKWVEQAFINMESSILEKL